MNDLTPAQSRVLDFIRSYMVQNQSAPTRTEIAQAMGYCDNAANDHLKALARKGFIKLMPHTARGIRLASMPTEQLSMMDVLAETANTVKRPMLSLKKA